MRKLATFVVATGLLAGLGMAGEVYLPIGTWEAKLLDFGAWWDPATGSWVPAGAAPAIGYEDRSIFQITSIIPKAGGPAIWPTAVPPTEELTGLFYDLVIGAWFIDAAGIVTIDWVPGNRVDNLRADTAGPAGPVGSGGCFDIWLDQTLDWGLFPGTGAPFSGPAGWVPWPGGAGVPHDDYPGAGDLDQNGVAEGNALWLYGNFVPLPAAPLLPGVAVLTMTVFPGAGFGYGSGYMNVKGGSWSQLNSLNWDLFGPGMDMSLIFDIKFLPNPAALPLYGWSVRSHDPVTLEVVPEPGTLLLIGSGLLGALGYLRRRIA